MKKKLLALCLSATMILSLITPAAFAEEPEGECCGACGQVECVCTPEAAACEVCGEIECVCEDAEEPVMCEICQKDPCACESIVELPEEEVPGADTPEVPEEPTACEACGEVECVCEEIEEPEVPEVPEIPEEPTACEKCGEIECVCEPTACENCGGEGCELCAEKPEIDFDVDAAYEYLMSCETTEEMDDYAEENFGDDGEVLFSAEQWEEICAHYSDLFLAEEEADRETVIPAVNYDEVAPLVEAAPEVPVRRAARLMTTRSTSSYALTAASEEGESSADNNGLELSKTVSGNATDGYTLTLEAYTTGTVTEGQATPSDIILIVDLSTSMREAFYSYTAAYPTSNRGTYYAGAEKVEVTYCSWCRAWTHGCDHWYGDSVGESYIPKTSSSDTTAGSVQFYTQDSSNSRLDALKTAATSFIGQVADQNTADNIAIVGFGQNAYYMTGGTAADAFLDATSNETALKSTINGIVEDGGWNVDSDLESATEHGKGLAYAVNIFATQTKDYTNRNKIVVMLTDGEPAPSGTDAWSSRTVKQAINSAYALKNTHDASVYTISVMPGTDASNPTTDMDKYMDYMSSNYPDAQFTGATFDNYNNSGDTYYDPNGSDDAETSETNRIIAAITPGTKVTSDNSYYLTAGDIDTLNSIFGQIADQTGGANISLGASTVIRDVISDSFELPAGADTSSITVTTQDATYSGGTLGWTTSTLTGTAPSVDIDEDGRTINVTNFDFDRNFVAETGRTEGDVSQSGDFHGRKIIIEIPIVVRDGFLGGNQVTTNGSNSGVYNDGTLVEAFVSPKVNILIEDVSVTAADKNVYLLGSLSAEQLRASATAASGSVSLDIDENDYGLEAWQYEYVNINVEDADGNVITDMSGLTADAQYSVSVTIDPKFDGEGASGEAATAKSDSDTGSIKVFKPVITFQDSAIDLGETANYGSDNFVSVVWMHGTTAANNMTGDEPALAYNYSPEAGAFTEDTPVQVKISIGDTDVTSHTTFKRAKCTFKDGCPTKEITVDTSGETWVNFIVHINAFDLEIIKAIADGKKPDQNFVFEITGPNGFSMTVVIPVEEFNSNGTASITVEKVPAGTYTIKELTDWSWRYTCNDAEQEASPSTPTVTFTNTRSNNQWLDGETRCQNVFQKTETAFVVNNNVVWKKDEENA